MNPKRADEGAALAPTNGGKAFWSVIIPILIYTVSSNFFIVTRYTYTPFMIRELLPELPEQNIGYYNGFLIGTYFLGQALNGIFIGPLTQKVGYNWALTLSAICGVVFPLFYGLSSNYIMANMNSFLYGLLNGSPTLVCALVHHELPPEEGQRGMGYIVGTGGILGITAPLTAGLLSFPTKYELLSGSTILKQYPFLLTNVMCALMNLVALLILVQKICQNWNVEIQRLRGGGVMELVEEPTEMKSSTQKHDGPTSVSAVKATPHSVVRGTSKFTALEEVEDDTTNIRVALPTNEDGEADTTHRGRGFMDYVLHNNSQVFFVLSLSSFLGMVSMIIDTTYPLLLMLPQDQGGFGMGTGGVATIQFLQGSLQTMFMMVVPMIASKLGLNRSFWLCALLSIPFIVALPFYTTLPWNLGLLLTTLSLGVSKQVLIQVCYMSVCIMINFCVYPEYVSHVNGLAVVFASMSRFIGPSLSNSLFAWSAHSGLPYPLNRHLTFVVYMVLTLVLAGVARKYLRPERERALGIDTP